MTENNRTAPREVRSAVSELNPLRVITLETPTLGNRSYLVHDGTVAFAIDPQRDIDRIMAVLAEEGVHLTHVFETHIHNDYVTGGHALARATGAEYLVNAADDVSFDRTPILPDQTVAVGDRIAVTALATPGHTFTHLSYALTDTLSDTMIGVFSGGSLLYGSTGRPDLLGPEHTEALAHHQHDSAHHLAQRLPDAAELFPTHGFGSFCSATPNDGAADHSTIGQEKVRNSALTTDVETWVADLMKHLNEWPAYYVHMAPANLLGPDAADLSLPSSADAAQIRNRLEDGEWVVDLRTRTAFAAGHAPGTLNFGLDGSLATYLGWLIPWGTPLTLLAETSQEITQAQRELARIGIDRPVAHATGGPDQWSDTAPASFARADFGDLAEVRHHRPVAVLDVRREDEFSTVHLEDAQNVALHELIARIDEVPDGEVWVHCAGGYRASIAASILAAHGRTPVAVDDNFDAALETGMPLMRPS